MQVRHLKSSVWLRDSFVPHLYVTYQLSDRPIEKDTAFDSTKDSLYLLAGTSVRIFYTARLCCVYKRDVLLRLVSLTEFASLWKGFGEMDMLPGPVSVYAWYPACLLSSLPVYLELFSFCHIATVTVVSAR